MKVFLAIIQIIVSVLVIILITLQTEGSGLGSAWGGGGSYHSKRGIERILFSFTIALVVLFFITSLLNFLLF